MADTDDSKTDNLELNELGGDQAGADQMLAERDGVEDGEFKPTSAKDLEAVYDIPVQVSAVLGKATMQVSQLLKLGRGAVVELDRKVGEAIDIYVNNRLVARGEVVVVEDRLGVTMTEIIKTDNS
jgi:flagellar motor switch protein FliN/FliY